MTTSPASPGERGFRRLSGGSAGAAVYDKPDWLEEGGFGDEPSVGRRLPYLVARSGM
ncbi:hypothetical protein ACFW1M_21480 [Streptomyces inhibens]|uniref:hypothetical protein n=1 Tax=Streptomyces inhibens TaxID=2293571 RepID=UPI0036BDD242